MPNCFIAKTHKKLTIEYVKPIKRLMRSALNTKLVIFDLDGTLLDTAPDLVKSLNHTIKAKNLPPIKYEDLNHLVGQGGKVMIQRAFKMYNHPLTDVELTPLYNDFIDHYLYTMPGKTTLFDGIIPALNRLKDHDISLAVCTNKTEALTFPLLEKTGLIEYFPTITCGDTFEWRKPDGRHITSTITLAGGTPENSVMIGDSINDIAAAKNAGIASIGVPFGYTDVPIEDLEPSFVINNYNELTPELITSLLAH